MNQTIFFTSVFLFVGYGIAKIYEPFLMTIAIAILLSIATTTTYEKIKSKIPSPLISTIILTTILTLVLFGPIVYFAFSMTDIVRSFDMSILAKTESFAKGKILQFLHENNIMINELEIFLKEFNIAKLSQEAFSIVSTTTAKSANFIKDILLVLIFYFFVNLYGKRISSFLISATPILNSEGEQLAKSIAQFMSVVIYSILTTAVFEGALFAVMVSFLGYDGILFGILYGFASLIPVVGGAIMWIPLSVYEYSQGNTTEALIIAFYTVIVISIIADTFIRPVIIELVNRKLIGAESNTINSMVIFFSIVAGLSTFGFWGAILGPGITSLFIAMIAQLKRTGQKNTQDD